MAWSERVTTGDNVTHPRCTSSGKGRNSFQAVGPITALFWDIGGVLLTNGWDEGMRQKAARAFGLDLSDLERRHAPLFPDLEAGRSTLDDYLDQVIFHRPRSFTREQFR